MATENTLSDQTASSGLQLEPHQVILRPLVTEKGVFQSESKENAKYTFEVHPQATKTQIKNSIETLFEVKVAKVATQTRKGKSRRYRFKIGETKDWKKAIVTLQGEYRIDFY
ncbi:MAG TPA: 50S ribosomal protein L23 [Pirellulaceae bacterium]|nr:50S ribosomal protein L23 [Pirellulaceae bacterium]